MSPGQSVLPLFDVASDHIEALLLTAKVAGEKRYHERLNRALNSALKRLERRDEAMYRDPSIQRVRLQRQARHNLETLLALATECGKHYAFHA